MEQYTLLMVLWGEGAVYVNVVLIYITQTSLRVNNKNIK